MRPFYEITTAPCPVFGVRYRLFETAAARDAFFDAMPEDDQRISRKDYRLWSRPMLRAMTTGVDARGNVQVFPE